MGGLAMAAMGTAAVLYFCVARHIEQEIGLVIDVIQHGPRTAHQPPRWIVHASRPPA